jgi:hypothetical protein
LEHNSIVTDPRAVLEKYRRFAEANQRYRRAIVLGYLPFAQYRVYDRWKPDPVKVLFLAESPPWDESMYFYNEKREGGLSLTLFDYLGIDGATKREKLLDFKRRGLFLADTVKCIFRKNVRKKIPGKLIRFSATEILEGEIEMLKPSLICVLGETALRGLKCTNRFSQRLSTYDSITDVCGKSMIVGNTTVVLSVFPNARNRKYEETIRLVIQKIRDA